MIACPCGKGLHLQGALEVISTTSARYDALTKIATQLGWNELNPGSWACPPCVRVSQRANGGGPRPLEHVRFRRALLDSLAEGEGYALTMHDRMRTRGFEREQLAIVFANLVAFEQAGLVSSRLAHVGHAASRRRLFKLTDQGVAERARLGVQ